MKLLVPLVIFLICTSGPSAEIRSVSSENSDVYCGGITDAQTVSRYFSDLRRTLETPGPMKRFNAFVGPRLTVTSKSGRTLHFHTNELGSVTPGRISIADWREISRRGASRLEGAGWRGCFFDLGKVWFEGFGRRPGQFYLDGINHQMEWVPEGSDSRPD